MVKEADFLEQQLALFNKCDCPLWGGQPRFIVWENVPGAFSSNKGLDFKSVLEEITKTEISMPQGDKWAESGMVECDECQLAWRVLDAQYWGVPQRRKRIFLVADFGASRRCAAEILFKQKSVRGDSSQGGGKGKANAADISESVIGANEVDRSVICFEPGAASRLGGHAYDNKSSTLRAHAGDNQQAICCCYGADLSQKAEGIGFKKDISPCLTNGTHAGHGAHICYSFDSLASNSMKSKNPLSGCHETNISKCLDTSDWNPSKNQGGIAVLYPVTMQIRSGCEGGGKGPLIQEDKSSTLATRNGQYLFCLAGNTIERKPENGGNGKGYQQNVSYTLNTIDRHAICVALENHPADSRVKISGDIVQTLNSRMGTGGGNVPLIMASKSYSDWQEGAVCSTLKDCGGSENLAIYTRCHGNNDGGLSKMAPSITTSCYEHNNILLINSLVRRLTPKECERLQGFPDDWTAGHSDTARYKALGNSVAVPCVDFIMRNIVNDLCE